MFIKIKGGGAYRKHKRSKKCIQNMSESLKESGYLSAKGRIILKRFLRKLGVTTFVSSAGIVGKLLCTM
jgi:hypothetical protein